MRKPVEQHDPAISSAEMTAHWRSMEALLSGDCLSTRMATDAGRAKAIDYLEMQYPFAARHFSLRAGYFMTSALALLCGPEANFDAVLSLGSGFSLLTYTIAAAFRAQDAERELYILDSDITKILEARKVKLAELGLDDIDGVRFEQCALDIEQAFRSGKCVQECFNPDIKKPIVILEGLSYFLSPECLQWLFNGLREAYPGVAIIWDYWPENLLERSKFFSTVLEYFKTQLPENVQALISTNMFASLTGGYATTECELKELEAQRVLDTTARVLTDEDTHIPARLGTLKDNAGSLRARL